MTASKREPDGEDLKLDRLDINRRLKRLMQPCPRCQGRGKFRTWKRVGSLWSRTCPDCNGTGVEKKEER